MRIMLICLFLVCLLLIGCQEDSSLTKAEFRALEPKTKTSYCSKLNLLYNEKFQLSSEDDVQLFYDKLTSHLASRSDTKLTGAEICKAFGPFIYPLQTAKLAQLDRPNVPPLANSN
jgi:hypothetical protein